MKYVINRGYGRFMLPMDVVNVLGCDPYLDTEEIRKSPLLVEYVERHSPVDLAVVIIPDEATDYQVFEYDGAEQVWFVLEGMMVRAKPYC